MTTKNKLENEAWIGRTFYHYTTFPTCLSVLNHLSIRLTDIRFLNDEMEQRWLWSHFDEVFEATAIERKDAVSLKQEAISAYVFCLCEEGDWLPLWRSYADDGMGVALGFEIIPDAITRYEFYRLRFASVIYDVKLQKRLIEEEVKQFKFDKKSLNSETSTLDENIEKKLFPFALSWNINYHGAVCKNPGFESEKEWRLVIRPGNESKLPRPESPPFPTTQFRADAKGIIPFVELPILPSDFGVLRLKEIVVGPRNPLIADGAALNELLIQKGFEVGSVALKKSTVSYRG